MRPVNRLTAIPLVKLPITGQQTLVRSKSAETRRALAANMQLDQTIIERLAADTDVTTSTRALPRSNDVQLVSKHLSSTGARGIAAHSNRLAPVEALEDSLTTGNRAIRLACHINPSTPEALRRQYLTPAEAEALTEVGTSLGERVIRAHELVLANRWMLETPGVWSKQVRRALADLPELTADQAGEIRKAGRAGNVNLSRHPVNRGVDPAMLTIPELMAELCTAADLTLIERPELSVSVARLTATRLTPVAEPVVLARLARRFGLHVVGAPSKFASTRVRSAAWSEPAMAYCGLSQYDLQDAELAAERLGESVEAWESFIRLAPDWEGSLLSLSNTSKIL